MSSRKTFQDLFQRYRRPGDFILSLAAFLFALLLLESMSRQTTLIDGQALYAQPSFWPRIAVYSMVLFSGLHLIGAMMSERIRGRKEEVVYWIRSIEFALWFIAYVLIVPRLGYLPATLIFTNLLAFRLGYRRWTWFLAATVFSIVVVIVFKGLLQVKIPAGDIYSLLPAGKFRLFVMLWL